MLQYKKHFVKITVNMTMYEIINKNKKLDRFFNDLIYIFNDGEK